VKTATPTPLDASLVAVFNLQADQVRRAGNVPLVFVFAVPRASSWDFFVIPQRDLLDLRERYVSAGRSGRGRPASSHADTWMFEVLLVEGHASAWSADLARWRNDWTGFRLLRLDRADATARDPSRSP
jgi:hypothetical protein